MKHFLHRTAVVVMGMAALVGSVALAAPGADAVPRYTAARTAQAPASTPTGLQTGQVVNEVPSLDVPFVRNGRVQALAQVGNTIVFGGTFTQVSDAGGTGITRTYLGAYDKTTHKLVRSFNPVLDGQVFSITKGLVDNSVYIAGDFTTLNGVAATRVAALDVTTGQAVPGFKAAPASSTVRVVALSGGRLLIGGTFAKVAGVSHLGLASLDPSTGKLTPYVALSFTVNHSYGIVAGANKMPTGIYDFAITPDGTQLTAIGNFRLAQGSVHDQIAQVDLTGATATVREDWKTSYFTASCLYKAYDSWVRTVRYSPDGSYFVVGSTGGTNLDLCDAIGRFETHSSGTDVQPSWIASTGGDSIYATAITDSAIYAGGHFRWFNNPLAIDVAGAGAVPRPGIVALDPRTGLPLPWNPGRHPRDKGVFAMLATDTDLTIGTDTEYIGYLQYHTYRMSNFPLAGGRVLATQAPARLPGSLIRVPVGSSQSQWVFTPLGSDGLVAGSSSVQGAYTDLSPTRVATMIDDKLYMADANGTLEYRSFNGNATLDPYNDPYWSTIQTGVHTGETYRGINSGLSSVAKNMTSMFFMEGTLYYTVSGSSSLYSRAFEPTTGISSPVVVTVPGVTLPDLAGGTWGGGWFYYARASDGVLVRATFDGTTMGAPEVIADSSGSWRSQVMFVYNS